jgi:hypothetical protein
MVYATVADGISRAFSAPDAPDFKDRDSMPLRELSLLDELDIELQSLGVKAAHINSLSIAIRDAAGAFSCARDAHTSLSGLKDNSEITWSNGLAHPSGPHYGAAHHRDFRLAIPHGRRLLKLIRTTHAQKNLKEYWLNGAICQGF